MGTPIAFNSGTTANYDGGVFKKGTIALNLANSLAPGYNWWNGVDVTSSQYLIYSDTFSQGQATFANSRPTAWTTPDLSDASLVALINTLPDRVGLPGFTDVTSAVNWMNQTGKYYLVKTGYDDIVTSGLIANFDAGWYNSYEVLTVCATAEENTNLLITAPSGYRFVSVDFASYGTPNGSCGQFSINTSCHAPNSVSIVEGYLLGQTGTVTIPASNTVFGDPCPGIGKFLYVQAKVAPTSIKDISGNFLTGTLFNGVGFSSLGQGTLTFDGTNDYGSIGQSVVGAGSSPYTVIVWCKRDRNNAGYEELLSQWTNAGSGNSFFFGFDGTSVRFTDNWNPVTVPGASVTGEWMCLVGVNTGSNAFIYLNGVLMATRGSALTYTSTGTMIIGRQGELSSEYFDGSIAIFQIYNRALSDTEILKNFNAQKYRFGIGNNIITAGAIAILDAKNPTSYPGTGTNWNDLSGNNNDGTLVNGVVYSTDLGGCLRNDSTNEGIPFPGVNNSQQWTICITFRRDGNPGGGGYGRIAGTYPAIDYGEIALLDNAGTLGLNPPLSVGWLTTTTNIALNEVCHLTVYFSRNRSESNNVMVWKNGVQEYTNTITSADKGDTTGYVLGARSDYNAENLPSSFVNVQTYNRKLSATEILQNYYQGSIVVDDLVLVLDAGNPVSYPATGTAIYDLSGNGYTGTLTNGPGYISTYGGGLSFDGTDDYIDLQYGIIGGTGDFTVSQWIQSGPSNNGGTTFGNYSAGQLQIFFGRNYIGMFLGNNSTYLGVSPWTAVLPEFTTEPVMITAIRQSSVTYFYINGVLKKTGSSSTNIGAANFRIGTNTNTTERFTGNVFITHVYDRALTPLEVSQNFQAQKSRFGL